MAGLCVLLDTNVLGLGLAYPASTPGRILTAWRRGAREIVLSRYILDEMARVLPRLKRIELNAAEVRDLTHSFMLQADIVEPAGEAEAKLRDSADQQVLGTWRATQAEYLITGDKDPLALGDRFPIVTPAVLWERHGA